MEDVGLYTVDAEYVLTFDIWLLTGFNWYNMGLFSEESDYDLTKCNLSLSA